LIVVIIIHREPSSLRIFQRIIAKTAKYMDKMRWENEYATYRKRYRIDPSFRFNGAGISLYGGGEIVLGARSYIGEHSSIQSTKGCRVVIGRDCALSHYIMIYTENRISTNLDETVKGNVVIGDGCWIGARVFITEGITIGEHSVVGANSVLTHDVSPYTLVAGCPAVPRKNLKTGERL
jgi:maltose O-acetyltransferase